METFTQELEKFDPTKAKLETVASEAEAIMVTDIKDKAQLAVVSEKRKELKAARVDITKTGKAMREDANAFTKKVLEHEKELIAIITPQEQRLESFENEHKEYLLIESRRESLPARVERLHAIGDTVESTDNELLEMTDPQFETYYNERVAAKNAADAEALESKIRKEEEEKQRREEAEEKAKEAQEEADKLKRDAEMEEMNQKRAALKAEEERIAAEQEKVKKENERKAAELEAEKKRIADEEKAKEEAEKTRIAQEAADKAAAEAKEIADAAEKAVAAVKAQQDAKYQEFLNEHGCIGEKTSEFHLERMDNITTIYMKTGEFTHE